MSKITTFYQEGGNPEFDAGIKEWINANADAKTNNGGNDMVSAVTVMGYDAYFTALEAIKAAGSTAPADILAALPGVTYCRHLRRDRLRRHRRRQARRGLHQDRQHRDRCVGLREDPGHRLRKAHKSLHKQQTWRGFRPAKFSPFFRVPPNPTNRRFSMQGILPYLISGISVGGQYALIAIGYTLVYGILRLINFAHGDVFMVAGLIMVYTTASMPMYISIPLVLIFTVILGFAIERVAYKPLRTAPRMSLMISAIGVSYLIQNLAFYLTGGLPQPVKTPIPWISDTVTLFGASTKRVTVVTPVLTIALVFALVALIKKTKIGMGMRAAAKDFETAQLMGVKINSVISMTFVIGSFLAAVGAMLYFTNYPTVAITSGGMPGLKAFVAAVFGGIGSIPGAVVGAFLIGLCEERHQGPRSSPPSPMRSPLRC